PWGPVKHWAVPLGLVGVVLLVVGLVVFVSRGGPGTPKPESTIEVATPSAKTPGLTPKNDTTKPTLPKPAEVPTDVVKNQPSTKQEPNGPTPPASKSVAATSGRVKEIFRAHCFECHGGSETKGDVKILDRDLLVEQGKVVRGQPD